MEMNLKNMEEKIISKFKILINHTWNHKAPPDVVEIFNGVTGETKIRKLSNKVSDKSMVWYGISGKENNGFVIEKTVENTGIKETLLYFGWLKKGQDRKHHKQGFGFTYFKNA